jgi:uncharacterized protein (TIGR03437 family)
VPAFIITPLTRAAFGFLLLVSAVAAEEYVISTFAGGPGALPAQLARDASLGFPTAAIADSKGAVYFTSATFNSVFKLDASGTSTRVAGTGLPGYAGDGGPATSAKLSLQTTGLAIPGGLALDSAGNLFIADTGNHRIRRVSPSGLITTVAGAGTNGFSGDGGPAINAQLYWPTGVAVDTKGNLFIAERGNNLVRRVSASGIITTAAGGGIPNYDAYRGSAGQSVGDGGPATSAVLVGPAGLAVDDEGNLFIADSYNNRVRKVAPDGTITTLAGNGTPGFSGDGGSATEAQLGFPIGVALDGAGNLSVLQLQWARVREISPGGTIRTVAGGQSPGFSGDGGPATSAAFANPFAIATDPAGNLYIADTANNRIRRVSPSGIILTVAGGDPSDQDPLGDGGPATSAELRWPSAVAIDRAGNVIIADTGHNRVRRVSPTGIITTVAGAGTRGFSGDGGPAASAQLNGPTAVAVDSAGNLFVADGGTRVRRVSADGTITTVAGNGTTGFPSGLGDGGPATSATLGGFVAGLAIDEAGNLFIADTQSGRIRKVSPDGIIRTVAGGGTSYVDGGLATDAQLGCPTGIVIAGGSNLLISERCRGVIRKISPAGIITTFAGSTAFSGRSGDGGPATSAEIPAPEGLALDRAGNLFIADSYIDDYGPLLCCDNRIRKVTPDGIITTVAGSGVPSYSGDGGPASTATLNGPTGVAVDGAGNVYVADRSNHVVRVLRPAGPVVIGAVLDAASQRANPISSGKIVVIYGAGLGPAQLVENQASGGLLGAALGGTTVSFNGIAAPILYTSATQIAAVAPYGIGGTTARVTVSYQGRTSSDFTVGVAPTSPSIFTVNQQGWGQAAAINAKDGTVNAATNPLKVGDYISLFATGEGQTWPGEVDGRLGGSTPVNPLLPVAVTIGGIAATVQYAGSVQGQVAGLMQVNVRIPDGVQPGGYVPVVLQVGDVSSAPDTVSIAVSAN